METFSALLALCAGNSTVTGEFRAQRPVPRSFDVFFGLCLNKRLSKQSWDWWFEMPSCSLWRHCNDCSSTNEAATLVPTTLFLRYKFVGIYDPNFCPMWYTLMMRHRSGSTLLRIMVRFYMAHNINNDGNCRISSKCAWKSRGHPLKQWKLGIRPPRRSNGGNWNGHIIYKDDLVQDCSKTIANALELLQSCTTPSIYSVIAVRRGTHH